MTAAELITELQSQGVVLTPHADGEHLRVRPAKALGPLMLAELKAPFPVRSHLGLVALATEVLFQAENEIWFVFDD